MTGDSRSGHWLSDTILSPRPPWYCNGTHWRTASIVLASIGILMATAPNPATAGSLPIGFWIFIAGTSALLVSTVLYLLQETQRRYYRAGLKSLSAGKCHSCAYPVTGHDQARCPECGSNIPSFIREARWAFDREQVVHLDDLARRV